MKFYTFEILVEKEPNDEPHMYRVDMSLQIKLWTGLVISRPRDSAEGCRAGCNSALKPVFLAERFFF